MAVKDSWGDWARKAVNVLASALAIGGLTTLTSFQEVESWEKAAVPGGVAFFGAIVQHLRSKP